ncbi:Thylakoid lumenal 16.5 kDa protein, chloroplastic [Heracleum sosnowskyi]|uniref:Thylakoid lumenal 16.5 kDa protein, chloroplastic n=1 Tax=Heracleum sosnowskyi TaxID=360622 RepID=A0AAD8IS23_9APIA|nr:Thylakoid lumenal 16.5 kDa protein, chloroplastic [Heracleum sosnowskyi]
MAATFVSNASTFLPSLSSASSATSSSVHAHNQRQVVVCKAVSSNEPPFPALTLSKRNMSIALTTTFLVSLAAKGLCSDANAAILEADDDIELLEKVKKDRQKRLEKQSVISSSDKEKGYVQDLVYKLSKVGQAIEKNDLPTAASVLGQKSDAEWVQKTNAALAKLSSSPEEKAEADTINSSLSTLISSVSQKDIKASTIAFVASANALEKWTILTGLAGQLKGL